MKIFGEVKITTHEFPDELIFLVERNDGWDSWVVVAIIAAVVVVLWSSGRELWACLVAVFGGASLAANWSQGTMARLRVTSKELLADGNLQRTLSTEIRIPVNEVTSIGWESGGEGGLDGFYARKGFFSSTCMMPGISKEQAESIRDRILAKYPDLEKQDAASILHGDDSGITRSILG